MYIYVTNHEEEDVDFTRIKQHLTRQEDEFQEIQTPKRTHAIIRKVSVKSFFNSLQGTQQALDNLKDTYYLNHREITRLLRKQPLTH